MIVAIVVVQAVGLVLLGVLVAGLLRSHAEILRALHQLGVSLDDGLDGATGGARSPLRLGPTRNAGATLPTGGAEATGGPAVDVSGVTPAGTALHVAIVGAPRTTLLAFLTSGCATCGNFWAELSSGRLALPAYVDRLVVVTRGVDRESPAEVLARAPRGRHDVVVVMSSDAWSDYQVPVSPYFVLVEGSSGRVVGEGAAGSWPQLESLLERAAADSVPAPLPGDVTDLPDAADVADAADAGGAAGVVRSDPPAGQSQSAGRGGRGGQRERADDALARAGIEAGHASLYGQTASDDDG
jgi:hypothetical protein